MAGLGKTWFGSGSTDTMVVRDVYQVTTNKTQNQEYSSAKGIYNATLGGLQTNKNSPREIAELVRASKAGGITKAEMITRALGAMGTNLPTLLGGIGGSLLGKISGAAAGIIGPGVTNAISVVYKNFPEKILNANFTDLDGMSRFLAEVTGDSDLLKAINLEAEGAIFGGLASGLIEFGIPSLIDDVIDQARSEEAKTVAYAFVSTSAVAASDLTLINRIIDKIGVTKFLENNPNAIIDIVSVYHLGTNDTVTVYAARRAELMATLVRINPYWNKWLRNDVYIDNLEPFTQASTDCNILFGLAEPEKRLSMIALPYMAKSVNEVGKSLYPNAYIS